MKKAICSVAVLCAFWVMLMGGIPSAIAADKQIVLKYAELAPKMVRTDAVMWWIKQVESRTEGRVKIEYYPGESLVKAMDMPEAVRSGLVDIAVFVTVYYPSKVPAWTMSDVGAVSDAYAVMMAYYDLYAAEPALQKDLDHWNCRLLFPQTSAGRTVIVFRSNVQNLSAIKGLKVRAVGDQSRLMTNLGAVPVPIAHPEVYTSLKTGTLDAALGFPSQAMSFGYWEVTKTWLVGAPGQYPVVAMINKDSWNKLPKDIQQIFFETGRDQVRYLASLQDQEEIAIIEKVQKEKGINVVHMTPEEVAQWRAQYASIWEEWKKDKEKRGIPGEKLLESFWRLTKKYGAQ